MEYFPENIHSYKYVLETSSGICLLYIKIQKNEKNPNKILITVENFTQNLNKIINNSKTIKMLILINLIKTIINMIIYSSFNRYTTFVLKRWLL